MRSGGRVVPERVAAS